jgi:hypothetical protein
LHNFTLLAGWMDYCTEQWILGTEAVHRGVAILLQLYQEGGSLNWVHSPNTWSFITRWNLAPAHVHCSLPLTIPHILLECHMIKSVINFIFKAHCETSSGMIVIHLIFKTRCATPSGMIVARWQGIPFIVHGLTSLFNYFPSSCIFNSYIFVSLRFSTVLYMASFTEFLLMAYLFLFLLIFFNTKC